MQRNCFEYLPITFVIDNSDKLLFETAFDKFQLFFNAIERHKSQDIKEINTALQGHPNLQTKAKTHQKYLLKESMFAGQNMWVFKPNDLNRGKGVNLFNSLEQLKKLINDYTVGVEVKSAAKQEEGANASNCNGNAQEQEPVKAQGTGVLIKSDVFVI
jgi:tubulin---tyrosine ligase